jgi:hypothetical protein
MRTVLLILAILAILALLALPFLLKYCCCWHHPNKVTYPLTADTRYS